MLRALITILIFMCSIMSQRASAANTLAGGARIYAGQCQTFSGTSLRLCMQEQGNLVLYNSTTPLWASNYYTNLDYGTYTGTTIDWGTNGLPSCAQCFAQFQSAGNLVLYNPAYPQYPSGAYWATPTAGNIDAILTLTTSWPYLSVTGANGLAIWPKSAYSVATNAYFVNQPTNNAVAWDQVLAPAPGATNLFVGRQCTTASCVDWKLVVAKMNWSTHALSVVNQNLFAGPKTIVGGFNIVTAYDPTLLYAHGELWVSFECSDLHYLGASACMGPIVMPKNDATGASWYVDASRTTVVVKNDVGGTSASAPKIFFFRGLPYMYYTAVHIANGVWSGVSTYGIELQDTINSGPGGVFWAAGYSSPATSMGAGSVEVMQIDPNDPISNQVADASGVYPQGPAGAETAIIMTGALGGSSNTSCLRSPSGLNPNSAGCYRQFIAKATTSTPLGTGLFNQARVSELENYMPSNLSQYLRRFFDPNGVEMVWSTYSPAAAAAPMNQWAVPAGTITAYPLNLANLNYQQTAVEYEAGQFSMTAGQKINLANGYLYYQPNGNLVLYNSYNTALWTSPVYQSTADFCNGLVCLMTFQSDGNFVQYRGPSMTSLTPYWNTQTNGVGAGVIFGIRPAYYHMGIQNNVRPRPPQWVWGRW